MNQAKKKIFIGIIALLAIGGGVLYAASKKAPEDTVVVKGNEQPAETQTRKFYSIYNKKILPIDYWIKQTPNNCAPAALSIALSYFDITVSQEELAADLRPNNNLEKKDDDKSTPPEELAEKIKEYGLIPYYRANGSPELIEQFISNDIPIVIRTLLYPDQDYAHYRVVKGYDSIKKEIIQDDSLEGKNLHFTYEEFNKLWQPFNYSYLLLVPKDKQSLVESILGEELDPKTAWKNAELRAREELDANPGSYKSGFNVVTALFYQGDYAGSLREFEKVSSRLPMHTMWYQMEPIQAYYNIGNYDKVFSLSNKIFADGNKGYSELYMLRGQAYEAKGELSLAKVEFEKALLYNKNLEPAIEALARVSK
jgi:tetratricopeptide (TPR) repeat protein